MKPRLVCVDETFLNGASGHHLPLFKRFLDVSDYDATLAYDDDTTFMYRTDESRGKLKKYEGTCKFIADGVWETNFFCKDNFDNKTLGIINNGYTNNERVLAVPKWFWFEEHFSQQDKKASIKDMPFTHDKTKLLLLQMGDAKKPRVRLYNVLKEKGLLANAIYSFLEYGIGLEGPVKNYDPLIPPFPQRAYRPEWYNNTQFTLIAECFQDIVDADEDSVFITEKTMKPIMYGHPFILMGDARSLKNLESWGFNTFSELFDQLYDNETDFDKRLDMVVNQVAIYKHKNVGNKIVDNFQRFWNTELVEQLMIKEMIEPMLEFISTK